MTDGATTDLRIEQRPELRSPVLVAAFAGWNDAGESATSAVRFMLRRWRAEPVAEIDPEQFYDFTQARPRVRLEQGERVLEWPPNSFAAHQLEDHDFDVLLLQGTEPHLSWRAYMAAVLELCREFHVSTLITLGALLAEASHTRPITVSGTSSDEELRQKLALGPRRNSGGYQGPTGIVGTLTEAAREVGIRTASLWANVPAYLDASPNPKGALALLERLNGGLDLDLRLHDLEVFCARFDAQVAAAIEQDPQMGELARRIEEMQPDEEPEEPGPPAEAELPDAKTMVDDLERFLREQREER